MTEAAGLAHARQAGVHCLRIPTPFAVGRVNTYLIEDEPLTLVDSGPNSAESLEELERQLAVLGHALEDLELVLITHQHLDHVGLVDVIARRSGATVAALDALAVYIGAYHARLEDDDAFAEALMLRHGVPRETVHALRAVAGAFRGWGAGAEVTRRLAHGDLVQLRDRRLQVLHRPGHSPTDTLFWDEQRNLLIAGDHLIKHISSNPVITRPLGNTREQRPRALVAYLESLRATRELAADVVLAGHGDPVTDHRALIDSRLRMHERRAARIGELIASQPRSAHEVAQELWGDVAVTQAYLTLSEVLGHADLLLDEGVIREVERDGVIRFQAVGADRWPGSPVPRGGD